MKSRRLAPLNSSNDGGSDLFLTGNSGNLSFSSPFSAMGLSDNRTGVNISSPSNNNHDLFGFNGHFNPSLAIIIIVLLSALFMVGFFSIYFRRRTDEDDSMRRSRRRPRGVIPQGWWEDDSTGGLDRAVIESFPVFSYDLVKGLKAQTKETLECAVCLSQFEDDELLRLLPKCSHAFHPDCIDTWLFSHTTCPICRIILVPTDDENPTGTGYGIIEPLEVTPPDEVTVVVDGTRSSWRNGSVRRDNDIDTTVASEKADSHESPGDQATEFSRSHSTGHSLVRLRKEMDQSGTEWYVHTAEGLKPGLHRNCSRNALSHSRSQGPSTSETRPALSKQTSKNGNASCSQDTGGSGRRWYERGLRSERLTISSMYPSSFLRSFSEHRAPA